MFRVIWNKYSILTLIDACTRFSICARPASAGTRSYVLSVADKYMSSQVRAGRFKGVENRGVADMPRSSKSLRFVDQH